MAPRSICFIDVETTGLLAGFHEIIEVAAIRVEARTLEIEEVYEAKIAPLRIEDAAPRALELTGYTPERWADAEELPAVLERLTPLLRECLLAGHNVSFDAAFLRVAYASLPLQRSHSTPRQIMWCPVGLGSYHKIDTVTMVSELWRRGIIADMSLETACRALGIEGAGRHSAMPDAMCSLQIARWHDAESAALRRDRIGALRRVAAEL